MKREEKFEIVNELTQKLKDNGNFYVTDVSDLTVIQTVELRKLCYKSGIELKVSKNSFIKKALANLEIHDEELLASLKGASSLMFSETVNAPAKIIKEFRRKNPKPILKAAYVQESVYVGDHNLEALINIKTKNELLGELVGLLNSPMSNLISALNSGGQKIMGVLDTISKK